MHKRYCDITVLVVIPAYNEEASIAQCISHTKNLLSEFHFHILVVNDGSTDRTHERCIGLDRVQVISHHKNLGYVAVLNTAIAYIERRQNCFTNFLFLDADGENNNGLKCLLSRAAFDADVAVGVRSKRNRLVEHIPLFRLFSRPRLVLDPFCGLKMFKISSFDFKKVTGSYFLVDAVFNCNSLHQASFLSIPARRPSRFSHNNILANFKLLKTYILVKLRVC